jgi:hypothetical protein
VRRLSGNAFEILGVGRDASADEVRWAYWRLVREFHPDLNPDGREEFEKVARAYAEVTRQRDLTRLKLKCNAVELKAMYADFLHEWQRVRTLTGISTPVRDPGNVEGFDRDQRQKMFTLGFAMMFRCPRCKHRKECDRATGYGEVEHIHFELGGR